MRYLRDHLIEHLCDAGRPAEAEAVACDLRWAGARVAESGPAALAADLSRAGTARAARLRAVLEAMAHPLRLSSSLPSLAFRRSLRSLSEQSWVSLPSWLPPLTVVL
jgi:hypothetical protein